MREIIIEENVLFWAFRYALGRSTYAVGDVADAITRNWSELSRSSQFKIKQEISKALVHNDAGMDVDAKAWEAILRLPLKAGSPRF